MVNRSVVWRKKVFFLFVIDSFDLSLWEIKWIL